MLLTAGIGVLAAAAAMAGLPAAERTFATVGEQVQDMISVLGTPVVTELS